CSADCGEGVRTRDVICGKFEGDNVTKVPDLNCKDDKRYPDVEKCNGTGTCKGNWFAGPWSKCSKECGGGTKHRKIFCYVGNKLATIRQCDGNIIPYSIETCNNEPCGEDEVMGPDSKIEDDEYCEDKEDDKGATSSEVVEDMSSGEVDTTATEATVTQSDEAPEEGSGFGDASGSGLEGWASPSVGPELLGSGESSGEIDESKLELATGKKSKDKKPSKCKPKPEKKDCKEMEFGCCQDGEAPATGPFQMGCPKIETCKDTTHGCCPDGATPAKGPKYKGCLDISVCENSLFGCCEDDFTEATGPNGEGCEDLLPFNCEKSQYGCCPDGISPASGENFAGCSEFECEGSGPCDSCKDTVFGCCPDGVLAAQGPKFEGCKDEAEEKEEATESAT
ncbi:hypothetical protein SK128_019084, partial [Halocaridina rubra]